MISLGVTGGIGAGKSTICQLFRLLQIPIFDADKEAKRLNNESPTLRQFYTDLIDESLYIDGKLDTKRLAAVLFSDEEKRNRINAKVHSELAERFRMWLDANKHHEIVVLDAALLFEAKFDAFVDFSVLVYAPEKLRIQRATARDGVSEDSIMQRMRAQMSEEDKIKLSNYIIFNDDEHSIIHQTLTLIDELREKSSGLV